MAIYISLLRGINVGGHKKIKMDQLRASLEAIDLKQVKTYIQSGNVVYQTTKASPATLSKKIEEAILKDFGHTVSVITRNAEEIKSTIDRNPFLKDRDIDQEKLHVMFLSEAPQASAIKQLEALISTQDRLHCIGEEIYFYLPNGVSESIVMKKPVDRILSVTTTMRNWRTVNTLHQMCLDCD